MQYSGIRPIKSFWDANDCGQNYMSLSFPHGDVLVLEKLPLCALSDEDWSLKMANYIWTAVLSLLNATTEKICHISKNSSLPSHFLYDWGHVLHVCVVILYLELQLLTKYYTLFWDCRSFEYTLFYCLAWLKVYSRLFVHTICPTSSFQSSPLKPKLYFTFEVYLYLMGIPYRFLNRYLILFQHRYYSPW